jgi:hypothetical protein
MGNKFVNRSEEDIRIETFKVGLAMHHSPSEEITVQAHTEKDISATYYRFMYDGYHFILRTTSGATVEISGTGEELCSTLKENPGIIVCLSEMFKCHAHDAVPGADPDPDDDSTCINSDEENAGLTWIDSLKEKGGQIAASLGGGAVGAVVGPTAVVGGVQALGFTSAGITAGSMAATAMSTTAIASGGGVASGSLVAVCQSIGALGVLSGGPLAIAVVGGAVVVGGVVGGAAYGCTKLHDSLKYHSEFEPCWDACFGAS